jgi:DNA-binding LacI/PurR family transcriptional regulator
MMRNNSTAPRRNSRPTIRDVAEAAGVSTVTVSNVVRGACFVRAERQEKVLDAIESSGTALI